MRITSRLKRTLLYGGLGLAILAAVPLVIWASLSHKPKFYGPLLDRSRAGQEEEARNFIKQSLQLRNDIVNEPTWEAVFSDREVNAWISEDFTVDFADQLPPEVHEPRIVFENDRLTLAFGLDQGPIRSVIWVVARVSVPEDNVVSLTLEKTRAGALPVPSDRIVRVLTEQASKAGLQVTWSKDGALPVATLRVRPDRERTDVVLERIMLREGQVKLTGRSNRATADARLTLPRQGSSRKSPPWMKTQPTAPEPPPAAPAPDPARSSTGPTS